MFSVLRAAGAARAGRGDASLSYENWEKCL